MQPIIRRNGSPLSTPTKVPSFPPVQVSPPKAAEKTLVLLRGVPGAGKSTITALLTVGRPDAVVCSADHYFTRNGVYRFDSERLADAHDACMADAEDAMMGGRALVIIDNCNVTERAMEPYEALAARFGYAVTHLVIERRGSKRRSVHGVPDERIADMAARLQGSIKV